MSVKITDLVDQSALDQLAQLKSKMEEVLQKYKEVAGDLSKGLDINVKIGGDIDKLEQLLAAKAKEAAEANRQLTTVMQQQGQVIANTTNTISRQLMEQERVNKTVREAYTEQGRVKELLERVNGSYEEHVKTLVKVNQQIAANKKAQDDLKKKFDLGQLSVEQYREGLVKLTVSERELKQQKADLNTMMKNEEREAAAVEGSYDHLSQQLELLKKAYKSMTDEEKQSELGKEMEESIQNLDAHLKDLAADMGEFQRNVGNYAVAGGSVKKELKELVLEIANLSIAYQNLSAEEQASAEGQALADHIAELTEQAGALRDAISDTNAAITNAASDTRGFDQLGGALQLAIDGFGLATGAAEILGISEGELEEIQTKLQAAIAASNAMQSIQNALQKQSAVMQGVNLAQTKLRTIAETIHTAAQGKGIIVTKAATAAQWAFNAAANANPIGLLVVTITAAIAVVWGLVKAFNALFGPSDEQVAKYEKQKKAVEDLTDAHSKQIDTMKAKGESEAALLEQSLKNKKQELDELEKLVERAKKLYGKDSDAYKEAVEAKKKAEEDWNKYKEDGLNELLKAVHEAEEAEREERLGTYEYKKYLIDQELEQQKALAAVLLEQGKITQEVYATIIAALDKAAKLKKSKVDTESAKAASEKKKKEYDELQKAVQAGEDAMLAIIADSNERQLRAEQYAYERKMQSLNEELAKYKDNAKMRKAILEQIEGLEAEHQNKLVEINREGQERFLQADEEFLTKRLNVARTGTEEEYRIRVELANNAMSKELVSLQESLDSKLVTQEQYDQMLSDIIAKNAADRSQLELNYLNAQFEREADIREAAYQQRQADLKTQYAKELSEAGSNEEKRRRITDKYERDLSKLSQDYAEETAQKQIDFLNSVLENEDLTDTQREELSRKLADAQIELANAAADAEIAAGEQAADADRKSWEQRVQNAQQWMDQVSQMLNSVAGLASAIYDGKIQQIEDEQDALDDASEEEQERITDLVDKGVISEEEGEARKRAAEAKTAKKKEELEKKEAALKRKQAIWDKTNSIAQASIATALAITKSLPNFVLAALAGAMGAIEIATIIATPIPQYAKGTDSHKGGLAVVGDGGRAEVITYDGKSWVTPSTPTVVDLPKGASVMPSLDKFLLSNPDVVVNPMSDKSSPVIINDYTELKQGLGVVANLIKQQTRQQHIDSYKSAYRQFKARI
jgi:hypothetical protein